MSNSNLFICLSRELGAGRDILINMSYVKTITPTHITVANTETGPSVVSGETSCPDQNIPITLGQYKSLMERSHMYMSILHLYK